MFVRNGKVGMKKMGFGRKLQELITLQLKIMGWVYYEYRQIFSKGASYLISEKGYEDYISGKDVTLGRPIGDDTVVLVAPSAEIDEAIIKTKSGC